jgi:hypothetical protein
MGPLAPEHVEMIELARELGAAANYTGSGGAIVGTIPSGAEGLARSFEAIGCAVLAPAVAQRCDP